MDEDIVRRRREEWLRTKGGGAKNGPNECHTQWKEKQEREKSAKQSESQRTSASSTEIPAAKPAVINEKKRAREDDEAAVVSEVSKRVKSTYELASFDQALDTAFSLVSWNLDGLTEKDLCERTMYFIDMMRKRKPAVIMLQEVTDFSMKFLKKFLNQQYHILSPPKAAEETGQLYPYYNALFLSKYHWELNGAADCIFFPHSRMGRHIIVQKVLAINLTDGKDVFVFGTTHLESLKDPECVKERVEQTGDVFKMMENHIAGANRDQAICVIVGGDFNARQAEINKAKKEFKDISDAWELAGSPPKEQYTWDMMINDNLRVAADGPAMNARCRFDRLYLRKNEKSSWNVTEFKVIGKQRIGLNSNMFVSDHWGLATTISQVDPS